jgi:protein-tyrosine phosphatase
MGYSADNFDFSNPIIKTSYKEALVKDLDGNHRPYFCLKGDSGDKQIVAQRNLSFEGAYNFRDMGGYINNEGRKIKWGLLYRSGHLSELTEKDQQFFQRLNIGLICDFRRIDEREIAPSRLPPQNSIKVASLPIHTGSRQSFIEKIQTGKTSRQDMMGVMREIYMNYANNHADAFSDMFANILNSSERAVLIHCSAGKDRTGFATALILSTLGVGKDVIMKDYMLSRQYFPIDIALARATQNYAPDESIMFDPQIMLPVYEVQPEYLNTSFQEIERQFGTIESYLYHQMGVTKEMANELKERFLE